MEVNSKIKELTEKIRKEGLEKAETEAAKIIEEAEKKASQIKDKAEKESAKIIEDAHLEAYTWSEKVKSDLRFSIDQSLLKLRNEIRELILAEILEDSVKENLNNADFVANILKTVVENWKDGSDNPSLEILLPGELHQQAEKELRKSAQNILNSGVKLSVSGSLTSGFEIKPEDGSYKISFTDEAFEAFLKENFRPVVKSFLFGEQSK